MKLLVIAMLAMAVAADHPPPPSTHDGSSAVPIAILRHEFIQHNDGTFEKHVETANGISDHYNGWVATGTEPGHMQGHFSYYSSAGELIEVRYVADDKGFRPVGDHLPTPVPTEYPLPKVPDSPGDDGSYKPQTNYNAPADVYAPPAAGYSAP